MGRRLRRYLHNLVEYDALERRKRSLALFFLIGVAVLILLAYIGIDSSAAADLWFFLLIRLVIGFLVAWLVLPLIWFLRRRFKLPKTPAGILFLVLAISITVGIFVAMDRAS